MANPNTDCPPDISAAEGTSDHAPKATETAHGEAAAHIVSNSNKEDGVGQCSLKSNRIDSLECDQSKRLLPAVKTSPDGQTGLAEEEVVGNDRQDTIIDVVMVLWLWLWQQLCYLSTQVVKHTKQFFHPTDIDDQSVSSSAMALAQAGKTETCTFSSCEFKVIPYHTTIVVELSKIHSSKETGRFFISVLCKKPNASRWQNIELQWSPPPYAVIENLQPAVKYEILMHAWSENQGAEAISIYSTTLPAGPPEQFVVYRSQDTEEVVLSWNPPSVLAPGASISGYTLKITTINPLSDNNGTTEIRQFSNQTFITQATLHPNYSYSFELYTNTNKAESSAAAKSGLLLHKHKLLDQSKKLQTSDRPAFQLPLKKTSVFSASSFELLEVGTARHESETEKVILIVGATGAGKTTLINSLVNYVLDVKYGDGFRFKLVFEPPNADQSISQTTNITTYKVHFQNGMKINYTLTIIDTPGFGDTRGIDRDKKVARELYDFFKSEHGVVDHLDAVGIVAPASLPRLTHSQTYIFDSILSLFGKDVEDIIYLLLTFTDGKPPQVLSAFKAAHFPYRASFNFNNSAIFDDVGSVAMDNINNEKTSVERDKEDDSQDDLDFNEMFWNLAMKSFDKFVRKLSRCSSISLKLTQEVLDQRARIELYVEELHKQVTMGLTKQEQLMVEQNVLKEHESRIKSNKNFTYKVKEAEVVKLPIKDAKTNTTCVHCNYTCHPNCIYDNDEDKHKCSAMEPGTNPVRCKICPNHCEWEVHKNTKFHYVTREVVREKTSEELKARYETAQGKKLSTQQLVDAIWEEFEGIQGKVMYTICEIRESVSVLQEIALKDNPLSTVEYIDILIQGEKNNGQPGWQTRTEHLHEMQKKAKHLQEITMGDYDPFGQYRDIINERKQSGADFRDGKFWTQEMKNFKSKLGSKLSSCVLQW